MNNKRFKELLDKSILSGKDISAEELVGVLTDEELLQAVQARNMAIGQLAMSSDNETVTENATIDSSRPDPYGYVDGLPCWTYEEYQETLEHFEV